MSHHNCHNGHHPHHHHHHMMTGKKSNKRNKRIRRFEEEKKEQNFFCQCCQFFESGSKQSAPHHSYEAPTASAAAVPNYHGNYVHGPCHDVDMVHWVNGMLRSNYGRVEELGSGTAYCQLMDMLFPGSLSLKKVKFQTTSEKERVENLLILRTAFEKVFVDNRIIPIDKLAEGNRQANLELLSWFRTFFSLNSDDLLPRPPPKFSKSNEMTGCQVPFCRGSRTTYKLPPSPIMCTHEQSGCHSHCCAH